MSDTPLLDHIGLTFKQAADRWEDGFVAAMSERGHAFIGEGRGHLFRHVPRTGIAQSALAASSGLTKQAVQQHLDALVADGLITRIADPADSRRKWVQPTDLGQQVLSDGEAIIKELDGKMTEGLGQTPLARLTRLSRLFVDRGDCLTELPPEIAAE